MNDLDTMKSAQTKLEKDENTMKMEIRFVTLLLSNQTRTHRTLVQKRYRITIGPKLSCLRPI